MRVKCDNITEKQGKPFTCGRFLAKIEGLSIEMKCPNCKKVHKVDINHPLEARDFINYLESSLQPQQGK